MKEKITRYDDNGNRIYYKDIAGRETIWHYDDNNHVCCAKCFDENGKSTNTVYYQYDDNGNNTKMVTITYCGTCITISMQYLTYDSNNRLIKWEKVSELREVYEYIDGGKRLTTTTNLVDGSILKFITDMNTEEDNIIYERDKDGNETWYDDKYYIKHLKKLSDEYEMLNYEPKVMSEDK